MLIKPICCISVLGIMLFSCQPKPMDTYHRLTAEQLVFIHTLKTGDTCIWENSIGLRDTGIVQPVVSSYFVIHAQHDGTEYGEKAFYKYKFIGTKKTQVSDGVYVSSYNSSGRGWISDDNTQNIQCDADIFIGSKEIGTKRYTNVYMGSCSDTAIMFLNEQGILGYNIAGETLARIQ